MMPTYHETLYEATRYNCFFCIIFVLLDKLYSLRMHLLLMHLRPASLAISYQHFFTNTFWGADESIFFHDKKITKRRIIVMHFQLSTNSQLSKCTIMMHFSSWSASHLHDAPYWYNFIDWTPCPSCATQA